MLTPEATLKILEDSGALLTGHFLLSSGQHSNRYIQCAQALMVPRYAEALGKSLAAHFSEANIDTVVGPALGGIIIAYEVARALGVKAIFTEREQGRMVLRRGFKIAPGERVLVVEDVLTTGGSVREVMAVVSEAGGTIAGVGALVNRNPENLALSVSLAALLTIAVTSFDPEKCPLCKEGIPAVKPGSKTIA
jgi:orotate phosphoribosyltransferase